MNHILCFLLLLCCISPTYSQDRNPDSSQLQINGATHIFTLGMGDYQQKDDYLSPLVYQGYQLHLQYEGWALSHNRSNRLAHQWRATIMAGNSISTSGYSQEPHLYIDGLYGLYTTLHPIRHLTILVGGQAYLWGGALYNSRNTNNPASASGSLELRAAAAAIYKISTKRLPVTLSYQIATPIAGATFALPYGASYYEAFMLESHIPYVAFTSFHNSWMVDHQLSVDLSFQRCTLRLGYIGRYRESDINQIQTAQYYSGFHIGFVVHLAQLTRKNRLNTHANLLY